MKKHLKKIIAALAIFIAISYFFDSGFLKGEITEYTLSCDKENYINYRCTEKWLPLNPTTYKPNVNKQEVLYWTLADIQTLTKCSVVDRKNWTCKYDDKSAEFGFKNGQYWESSLDPKDTSNPFVLRHVPKFVYRLEEFKWW